MKVPINELQCLRKDGALMFFRIDSAAQLAGLEKKISGFYFGHPVKNRPKEELEAVDDKKGI